MKAAKRKKLEAAGWKVGSVSQFLELSDAEAMLVNVKLALSKKAKELRQSKKITQNDLAKLLGSSQSRVAKLETSDRSVSLELLIRALVTLGATRAQIGKIVGAKAAPTKKTSASKKRPVKA